MAKFTYPAEPGNIPNAIVGIPARNEEGWIVRCLTALAHQQGAVPSMVFLLVNNSVDRTAALAREAAEALALPAVVIEHCFKAGEQTAGRARRFVMQRAADALGPSGVLLCTDADGEVAPDWLAANLFHIRHVDAVAGQAILFPADAAAIPQVLHDDDARECEYAALLNEIDSIIDPDAADPWPRHSEHSGASICVRLDAYRRAGGIPASDVGEDRAFFSALRRIDARIRHAPDVRVMVSGRIEGRAVGGMADTIRRRIVAPDAFIDDALEPAGNRIRRARLRAIARTVHESGGPVPLALRTRLACDWRLIDEALSHPHFGQAWATIEAASPTLIRQPLAVTDLAGQTAMASRALSRLRSASARSLRQEERIERSLEYSEQEPWQDYAGRVEATILAEIGRQPALSGAGMGAEVQTHGARPR